MYLDFFSIWLFHLDLYSFKEPNIGRTSSLFKMPSVLFFSKMLYSYTGVFLVNLILSITILFMFTKFRLPIVLALFMKWMVWNWSTVSGTSVYIYIYIYIYLKLLISTYQIVILKTKIAYIYIQRILTKTLYKRKN